MLDDTYDIAFKKQETVQSAVNKNAENETREASACQQFLRCSLSLGRAAGWLLYFFKGGKKEKEFEQIDTLFEYLCKN